MNFGVYFGNIFLGRIDFAEFLDILHHHLQTEEAGKEILAAFRIYDTRKTGYISTKDLKFLLTMTGEKLTNKDGRSLRLEYLRSFKKF